MAKRLPRIFGEAFCCIVCRCGFPLWGKLSPQVTDEGELCGDCPSPRRGGVTPPYGAIKTHHPVGAGHAPPATLRLQQHNGYSVGAAYMPPAQPPGYYDITGKRHGTVKTVPYKPAGNLHFPPLYLTSRLFVGRGLDPSLPFCGNGQSPGGVGSPRPTLL